MARDSANSNGNIERRSSKPQQHTVINIEADGKDKDESGTPPAKVAKDKSSQVANSNGKPVRYVYQGRDHMVEIYSNNLKCLSPATYLDDSIVRFYIAYLLKDICTESTAKTIHVFDNYFHKRLCETFPQKNENRVDQNKWRQLNKWFNGVDIFEKSFLIFPICQEEHWFVVIVCHPGEVIDTDHEELIMTPEHNEDTRRPKPLPGIIVMDSLGMSKRTITKEIREFLDFEWRTRLTTIKDFSHHNLVQYHPKLPTQTNAFDCGIYTLAYLKAFATMPEKFYRLVRDHTPTNGDGRQDLPQNMLDLVKKTLDTCGRDAIKALIQKSCKIAM